MRGAIVIAAGLLASLASCARGGSAQDDAAGNDSCTPATYFADLDHDGHGDPAAATVACVQPANTVTVSDDCDDANDRRFPGASELCDGLDNDCDATTVEVCPAGCTVEKRAPPDDVKTYLFCAIGQNWVTARATCNTAGYKLAEIDSIEENAFVRATANTVLGAVDIHIGGTDSVTEGVWVWDGGDQFWQGGAGGVTVGGHFASWTGGEPNNDNNEDCAEMKAGTGAWNDGSCGDGQKFVCRD